MGFRIHKRRIEPVVFLLENMLPKPSHTIKERLYISIIPIGFACWVL
jgi:hypothetical protein